MTPVFDNSYAQLPERFYTRLPPVPVREPGPIRVNRELAALLGIDADWLASDTGTRVIAGNEIPTGAEPIATVYAGHQFGSWNPRLGDGRAILLGEVIGGDGERYDIQLKGSGITPYSRNGDGRAPLGPVLREYIVSEAMAALGIPTSRSLAAVTTGESVYREQAFAGGILARVAKSHIRVGTLQYFASVDDHDAIQLLVDHIIARHYPAAAESDSPALAMYQQIIGAQAELIAHWQSIGFIHGVMNTDNMLLSGETIDYGPCAFMDRYDSAMVFSSIDHGGRYAYRNQPAIGHWNLACLANALLPLFNDDQEKATEIAQDALNAYPDRFFDAFFDRMRAKLGLVTNEEGDTELLQAWLDLLEQKGADFTLAFRRLAELPDGVTDIQSLFDFDADYSDWLNQWRARCARESLSDRERGERMRATNPALIARNHLVEAAIEAGYAGDFDPFHQLVERLAHPYDYSTDDAELARPPKPAEVVQQTFCGT